MAREPTLMHMCLTGVPVLLRRRTPNSVCVFRTCFCFLQQRCCKASKINLIDSNYIRRVALSCSSLLQSSPGCCCCFLAAPVVVAAGVGGVIEGIVDGCDLHIVYFDHITARLAMPGCATL